ncbi:MAG: 2-oxoglutarate dehydrogenase complex dihydrolipoyllysine-residue succinyltransferase [Alphaproteobacteria bacterium]
MSIEIKVPAMGESVTEATIAKWFKKEGDAVQRDEPVVELETDKVTVEVPSPAAGTLDEIRVKQGQSVKVGTVLGAVKEGKAAAKPEPPSPAPEQSKSRSAQTQPQAKAAAEKVPPPPSVRRIAEEEKLDADSIAGTGKRGQVTKADAIAALEARAKAPKPQPASRPSGPRPQADREERVPMSRLRRTIAARLKESQNTAAQLTSFNEADMSPILALRAEFRESFQAKHGVKLGLMGFFVRASTAALKDIPTVNAEIDGDDIVYKNFYDIGIAVSTDKGLVVPVLRDVDQKSIAEIEAGISDFAARAREGRLKLEELQGGTFTITNGGVFGSLMSTPILNTPQSGILGMHKIQERPVAAEGKIVIRPMMYLALSYDHRLVDGREAVTFLVRVKEELENPQRMLLDI